MLSLARISSYPGYSLVLTQAVIVNLFLGLYSPYRGVVAGVGQVTLMECRMLDITRVASSKEAQFLFLHPFSSH